jgi:hypothetical protein
MTQLAAHFGVSIKILLDDEAVLPSPKVQAPAAIGQAKSGPLSGAQLSEKWHQLSKDARLKIADQIVDHLAKNISD